MNRDSRFIGSSRFVFGFFSAVGGGKSFGGRSGGSACGRTSRVYLVRVGGERTRPQRSALRDSNRLSPTAPTLPSVARGALRRPPKDSPPPTACIVGLPRSVCRKPGQDDLGERFFKNTCRCRLAKTVLLPRRTCYGQDYAGDVARAYGGGQEYIGGRELFGLGGAAQLGAFAE